MAGKTSSQRKQMKKKQARPKEVIMEPKKERSAFELEERRLWKANPLNKYLYEIDWANRKDVLDVTDMYGPDAPLPENRPAKVNHSPLEEFSVRDSSGKVYTTQSPAIKMMISNQRPVRRNAKGDYMFDYPGFAPFKTYLSCVYMLMDSAMETSYMYDGNGHTLPTFPSPACMMCKDCDSKIQKPLCGNNHDVIVEIELCDGHVYEHLTKNEYSLPTKRDHSSADEYQTKTHLPNKGPVGLSQENNKELYDLQKQTLDEDHIDINNLKIKPETPPAERNEFDDVE